MPLVAISSQEAFRTRKSNPEAVWPERGENNRLEPIARLRMDLPFRAEPGSSILTVGLSCFARQVESILRERGFTVPVRDLMESPEYEGVPDEVFNIYGIGSLHNELAWALDPQQPYLPAEHFVELQPGRFVDVHLGWSIRPVKWEVAARRRDAIANAYRIGAACETIWLNLAISEVWFDTVTGLYLNHTPRHALLRACPRRFELHVLSYEEVRQYLFKSLELLQRGRSTPPNVILTISPVPLASTHRDMDVAVANSFCKSALRTAAEEASIRYPFVAYCPTYEAMMLSDRQRAWMENQVHVTPEIVAVQAHRAVDALTGGTRHRAYETLSLPEAIECLRSPSDEAEVPQLLSACAAKFGEDPDFALEHGRYLLRMRQYEEALDVFRRAGNSMGVRILRSRCLRALGRAHAARTLLADAAHPRQKIDGVWAELVAVQVSLGNVFAAVALVERWAKATRGALSRAYLLGGRMLMELDVQKAIELFEKGMELDPGDEDLAEELARVREATGPAAQAVPAAAAEVPA
jgi:tetratricopeptide (TPR) repeat protein